MARICTKCGKEISDTAAFCTGCGAPAPAKTEETADKVNASTQDMADTAPEQAPAEQTTQSTGTAFTQPQAAQTTGAVFTQPQTAQTTGAVFTQPQVTQTAAQQPVYRQPTYQQPVYQTQPAQPQQYDAVGTGYFFGMMFLYAIPVIGWLICIISMCAAKNPSKKHFAKAVFIWLIIGLVFAIIGYFVLRWIGGMFTDFLKSQLGIGLGDLSDLSNLSDLSGLGGLTDNPDIASIINQLR